MMRSRFGSWLAPLLTCVGVIACGKASLTRPRPIERDSLSFRVLVDGQPLVRTEVQVSFREWTEGTPVLGSGSFSQPTDEAGQLVLTLYSLEWSDPQELEVTVVHGERFGKHRGPRVRGQTMAEDLVLEPMPILTAGRVVDPEGSAVSDAEVIVVDAARINPPRGMTDQHGEFVLRVPGDLGPADQRLFARHGERLSPLAPVDVGSREMELVLSSATGGLTGRVLLDPEIPAEQVSIQLYAGELGSLQTGRGLFELGTRLASDGGFELLGRVPGRHRARVLVNSHELLVLHHVQVQPGPPGSDPRLDPLDLRGKIHVRRVHLISSEGQSVTGGSYLAHRRGSRDGAYMPFEGSELLILSPHPRPSVEIRVVGFRTLRLDELGEDRTVELQPGWPVRLVLDEDVRLPEPPVTWSLELSGVRPEHFALYSPLHFDPGCRDVRLVAMDVGEYEVLWHRGTPDDPPFHCWAGGQRGWPRQIVHVRDVPEEQVLRLGWVPVAP